MITLTTALVLFQVRDILAPAHNFETTSEPRNL